MFLNNLLTLEMLKNLDFEFELGEPISIGVSESLKNMYTYVSVDLEK